MDQTPQDVSRGAIKKKVKFTAKIEEEYEYLNKLNAEREREERRKTFLAECEFPRPNRFAGPKKTPPIDEESMDENEGMPSIFGEFDFESNIKYSNEFIDTMISFEEIESTPPEVDSSVTSRGNSISVQQKYNCKKPVQYPRDFSGATRVKRKSPSLPVIWEISHESMYTDDHRTKKRGSILDQKPQVKK